MIMDDQLRQVLSILVQGSEMGQRAGAFDLKTASVIAQAVDAAKDMIEPKEQPPQMEVVPEEPKTKK